MSLIFLVYENEFGAIEIGEDFLNDSFFLEIQDDCIV